MARIILFLLSFFVMVPPGKETKKTTVPTVNQDYREVFYVLKSDPSIRHGAYRLAYKDQTLVAGFYNMGLRDSTWMQYNERGELKVSGQYSGDKRVGSWKFFDNNSQLEQEIDMTTQRVLFYKTRFSNHPFKIIDGTDTIVSLLDRPPLYIGGTSRISDFIAREMVVPLHKKTDKTKGTVFVEFIVDSTGQASTHRVLKGFSASYNLEALRVVRLLPSEWLPGVLHEHNVSVFYTIPVLFDEKVSEFDPGLLIK